MAFRSCQREFLLGAGTHSVPCKSKVSSWLAAAHRGAVLSCEEVGKRLLLDAGVLCVGKEGGDLAFCVRGTFWASGRSSWEGTGCLGALTSWRGCPTTVALGDVRILQQGDRINSDLRLFAKGQAGSACLNMPSFYCNSDNLYNAPPRVQTNKCLLS